MRKVRLFCLSDFFIFILLCVDWAVIGPSFVFQNQTIMLVNLKLRSKKKVISFVEWNVYIWPLFLLECVYEFSSPCRYIFKGAELNDACLNDDNDDDDSDNNLEEDSESELNDENNDTNKSDSMDPISDESVTQLSSSVESSDDSFAKISKSSESENQSFNQENARPTKNLPLVDRENGQANLAPIHSTTDSIHCAKKTEESIDNFPPNFF